MHMRAPAMTKCNLGPHGPVSRLWIALSPCISVFCPYECSWRGSFSFRVRGRIGMGFNGTGCRQFSRHLARLVQHWRGAQPFSSHLCKLTWPKPGRQAMWAFVLQFLLTKVASQEPGFFSLRSTVPFGGGSACIVPVDYFGLRLWFTQHPASGCDSLTSSDIVFYWNKTWLVNWYYQKCVDFYADPSMTYPLHGRSLVLSDCAPGQPTMEWVWQDGRIRHAHIPFCADFPGVNSTKFWSSRTPLQLGADCTQSDQLFHADPWGARMDWNWDWDFKGFWKM